MARNKNSKRSDGRLQSKVYLGVVDGKAKYKYVYASTQKELNAKVMEIKIALGRGIDVTANNDKFGYWSAQWLKLKKQTVSNMRYLSYASVVKKLDILNNSTISKITVADIQGIIFDNSELSGNTLIQLKSTVKQIFQLAIDSRIIDYNPAVNVKIPKKENVYERRALTDEERQWIIDTPDYMQLPAMIMIFAGLRRGEVIALQWNDIDFDNCTITVNKSAEVVKGTFTLKNATKTEAGMRTVYVPRLLIDYLKKYSRSTNLLVFPAPMGGMISTKTWNRKWNDYLKKLNEKYGDFSRIIRRSDSDDLPLVIPHITPHWLRHTFITMMYFAGVDVLTAKEQAGHSDIRTTMAIYTHLDSKYKAKSMQKLNDYLENGCQMGVNKIAK